MDEYNISMMTLGDIVYSEKLVMPVVYVGKRADEDGVRILYIDDHDDLRMVVRWDPNDLLRIRSTMGSLYRGDAPKGGVFGFLDLRILNNEFKAKFISALKSTSTMLTDEFANYTVEYS